MFDTDEIAGRALGRADEIKETKRRNRKRIETSAMLCGICLVVVLAITLNPGRGITGDTQIADGQIPLAEMPLVDIAAKPYDGTPLENGPGYTIPVYGSVTMKAGQPGVKIALTNPESNPYSLTFEITLAETGEQLYMSGLVEKGMYIENIDLGRPLPQGIYKATLTIRAYEPGAIVENSSSATTFEILAE